MKNTITANSERIKTDRKEIKLELVINESITPIANNLTSQLPQIKAARSTETLPVSSDFKNKIAKRVGFIVALFKQIFNWLNGIGSNEIDVQRMESRNDQQLGIRKWNL
jgi:hypothetical protein